MVCILQAVISFSLSYRAGQRENELQSNLVIPKPLLPNEKVRYQYFFFQNWIKCFFGYFDPENVLLDNENK